MFVCILLPGFYNLRNVVETIRSPETVQSQVEDLLVKVVQHDRRRRSAIPRAEEIEVHQRRADAAETRADDLERRADDLERRLTLSLEETQTVRRVIRQEQAEKKEMQWTGLALRHQNLHYSFLRKRLRAIVRWRRPSSEQQASQYVCDNGRVRMLILLCTVFN